VVSLDDYFCALSNLFKNGMQIASQLGFGDMDLGHIYDDTTLSSRRCNV